VLVEDSHPVADALKKLLQLLGANVSGPAATVSEAESLLAQHLPDVALVDAHLRGGEYSTKSRSKKLRFRSRELGWSIVGA